MGTIVLMVSFIFCGNSFYFPTKPCNCKTQLTNPDNEDSHTEESSCLVNLNLQILQISPLK